MSKKVMVVMMMLALSLSCGGGGGSSSETNNPDDTNNPSLSAGLNGATTLTGVVKAENGDPIPGATVYIPNSSIAGAGKSLRTTVLKLAGDDGTTCGDPAYASCASTCSSADGSFTMDVSGCSTQTQLVLEKGSLRKLLDLNCSGDVTCNLTSTEGQFGSGGTTTYPKVAVVTGSWDRIQDVLAKIAPDAYGAINADWYELEVGTENKANLTFIDGNNSLDDAEYDDFSAYLDGAKSLD